MSDQKLDETAQYEYEELRCRHCGSRDVRKSYPNGLVDSFFSAFRMVPFRCRECGGRFYKRLPAQVDE